MKRRFIITEEQLEEVINSNLMFSTETTPEFNNNLVSTTEPVDGEKYGDPITGDDMGKMLPPGLLQRMTTRGAYNGPFV